MADKDSPASVKSYSKRSNGRAPRSFNRMQLLLNPDPLVGNSNPPSNNRIAQNHNAGIEHQETEQQEAKGGQVAEEERISEDMLPINKRKSMRVIHQEVVDAEVKVIHPQAENLNVKVLDQLYDPEVLFKSPRSRRRTTGSWVNADNGGSSGGCPLTRSRTGTLVQNAEAAGIAKEQVTSGSIRKGDGNGGERSTSSEKRKPVDQGGRDVRAKCGSDQEKKTTTSREGLFTCL